MLLTIHNLPPNVTFAGIKQLIQDNCNITQVILDNLTNEGQGKRVTVGLADEGDAALLVRKINGLFMNGYHIYVEDVRQKKHSEQPYCPMNIPQMAVPKMQNPPFDVPMNMAALAPPTMPPYNNLPFYMSSGQKYVTYNTTPPVVNPVPPPSFHQQNVPYRFNTNDGQSQWKEQAITYPASGSHRTSNVETRQYSPRPQETNWRDRRESPSRSKEGQGRRDPENFDRSHDKTSRRNEHNRSDYRRDNSFNKSNRYSRAERSPPRERHENRDSRDGKFDNNRRGPNRGEQSRDRNSNNNQNYDNRRPDRDFDRNNQYHNQKRDFGSKRSYAEHSEAHSSTPYSNNPNNSTFTNTNANKFGHKSSNFQTGGPHTNYHGPPSKIRHVDRKAHDSTKPPRKMIPPVESVNRKADVIIKPKDTLQTKLNRHNNWIGNAGAQLASAIIKNSGVGFIPNYGELKKKLRKCIISRIDVILHDHITSSLREVIMAYRSKFTVDDDPGFLEAVMEKHKRDLKEAGRSYSEEKEEYEKRPKPSTSDNKGGIGANQNQQDSCPNKGPKQKAGKGNTNIKQQQPNKYSNWENKQQAAVVNKFSSWENFKNTPNPRLHIRKPNPSQRLPKFPKGDKQIYKDQKKLEKLEYSEEVYTLPPLMKKALDEEMNEFCKGFLEACDEPLKCDNNNIYSMKIKRDAFPKFKQIVELHITKRLLNISNNLVVRIFSHPKMPKRVVLEQFLRQYDVASLKKSDKKRLFLATCANYKTYDALLHLAKAKVGENTIIQFKPLNLTGPRQARNANKTRKGSNIPPENIISDDEVEMLQEESNMDIEDLDHYGQGNDYDNPDYDEGDEHDDDNINLDDYDTHTDDVIEKCVDANPRLDDSDVVFLETKNDVVVIEDNDKPNEISDNVKKPEDAKNSEATDAPIVKNSEATDAAIVKNSEATDAPIVKNSEATDAAIVKNSEETGAPIMKNSEETDAAIVKNSEATDAAIVKNSEAADAPIMKNSEATDAPIMKNSEATDAPNLNKDDVNKNVVTVNEENNESIVGNNEDYLDEGENFDECKMDEVTVRDDDLEDF